MPEEISSKRWKIIIQGLPHKQRQDLRLEVVRSLISFQLRNVLTIRTIHQFSASEDVWVETGESLVGFCGSDPGFLDQYFWYLLDASSVGYPLGRKNRWEKNGGNERKKIYRKAIDQDCEWGTIPVFHEKTVIFEFIIASIMSDSLWPHKL